MNTEFCPTPNTDGSSCARQRHHGEEACRQYQHATGAGVRPYPAAIALMMDGWDGGDQYASATSVAFALGDLATAADIEGVHAALDYRPGAGEAWTMDDLLDAEAVSGGQMPYETFEIASAYSEGEVDNADVLLAARVISRYLDVLKTAGLGA